LAYEDCAAPFSSPEITIGKSTPWELTATGGNKLGYDVSLCYKCVSDNQPDGATFKWNVKQTLDCSDHVKTIDGVKSSYILPYDANAKTEIATSTSVFTVSHPTTCGAITACSILASDC